MEECEIQHSVCVRARVCVRACVSGPFEEGRTKCLEFHSINAVGPIKGPITQIAGQSLKYKVD